MVFIMHEYIEWFDYKETTLLALFLVDTLIKR